MASQPRLTVTVKEMQESKAEHYSRMQVALTNWFGVQFKPLSPAWKLIRTQAKQQVLIKNDNLQDSWESFNFHPAYTASVRITGLIKNAADDSVSLSAVFTGRKDGRVIITKTNVSDIVTIAGMNEQRLQRYYTKLFRFITVCFERMNPRPVTKEETTTKVPKVEPVVRPARKFTIR
jgi:hypothetical protein